VRSTYQGIFLLEDLLADAPSLPADFEQNVTFPFRDRYVIWDCLLTGQTKEAIDFDLESHVREAVRLGFTGMECNRFLGMNLIQQGHPRDPYPWYTYWGPSMDQFVSSPLFDGVFPAEYLARNLADLKNLVEVVKSFGLKAIFVGYEPRYVPEEFLQRNPELRGPRVDHPLRSMVNRYSLCTDRPRVREHYRILARRLAEEVPDLDEMWVIFHDSGTGFCWSHSLYSGRNGPEFCRNVPMGKRLMRFFTTLKEGLKEGGLTIPVVAQPHGSSRPEIDDFFDNVPNSVEFTAGNWASWSLTYRDPLGVDRYVLSRSRQTDRRTLYYQQHFFGFNGAPTTEFPAPYFLVQRLKRALELDLDVLNTLGGFVSPPIQKQSGMQEVYRRFLLEPQLSEEELVARVAQDLGGRSGGQLLVAIWRDIHNVLEENGRQMGFALGTEYTSRRTLVRPLVPESSALSPEEREWWLAYTFAGNLRYGHAHLFRGEGGTPPPDWYELNRDRSERAKQVFRGSSSRLQEYLGRNPSAGNAYPYLVSHERQLRFLSHVYATGANLYEGQRIIDKYYKKNIYEELKNEVQADLNRFKTVVCDEISNTRAFLEFLQEEGEIGMVLLPQETTWAYSRNLPDLLRRKIEIMERHLPEAEAIFTRWFNSEY